MSVSNGRAPYEDDRVPRAQQGDREALESLVAEARDLAFNLALRMLGMFADAEDATQEIVEKVIAGLPGFRCESAFSTWVFRIAANHLSSYRKHMMAQMPPLTFEFYAQDIEHADIENVPDLTQGVDRALLAEELKLSCTNVMLQCLDTESRTAFVLGTMFNLDSAIAGEVLGITPEAYRQRLSRARRTMADFLSRYCGAYGEGSCACARRVDYAIWSHRLNPARLEYAHAAPAASAPQVKQAMERIDDLSQDFAFCRPYESTERVRALVRELLDSADFATVSNA